MSRHSVSRTAASDLDDIWLYVAKDRNSIEAADQVVREITGAFGGLAEFPGKGPGRPEFGEGLRSFPVGPFVIFYKKVRGGIRVVRILHGARNLRRIFRRRK